MVAGVRAHYKPSIWILVCQTAANSQLPDVHTARLQLQQLRQWIITPSSIFKSNHVTIFHGGVSF